MKRWPWKLSTASSNTKIRTKRRKTIRAMRDYLSPKAGAVPTVKLCIPVVIANSLWRNSCDPCHQPEAITSLANCLNHSRSAPVFQVVTMHKLALFFIHRGGQNNLAVDLAPSLCIYCYEHIFTLYRKPQQRKDWTYIVSQQKSVSILLQKGSFCVLQQKEFLYTTA